MMMMMMNGSASQRVDELELWKQASILPGLARGNGLSVHSGREHKGARFVGLTQNFHKPPYIQLIPAQAKPSGIHATLVSTLGYNEWRGGFSEQRTDNTRGCSQKYLPVWAREVEEKNGAPDVVRDRLGRYLQLSM
jgi:hypothetical protein